MSDIELEHPELQIASTITFLKYQQRIGNFEGPKDLLILPDYILGERWRELAIQYLNGKLKIETRLH